MSGLAVETFGLSKEFEGRTAVKGLSFSVGQGELFALVGPDGAGKTTTLRMLCGLLAPSSGSARVLGLDLKRDLPRLKREIGYLSQRFSLYGDLSVDENLEFFAEIHGQRDYEARREELLEFTRLKGFRRRLADRLSGGMKQKLALACTLIHRPRLLLLDEPSSGLDPVSRRELWLILSSLLRQGITIVISTPYLEEAERCTRVGMLSEGNLLRVDTPGGIKSLLRGSVLEVVCSDTRRAFDLLRLSAPAPAFLKEAQIYGDRLNLTVEDPERDLQLLRGFLQAEGILLESWRIAPPSLENAFITLMKSERSLP